jgi:Icc-related predicted phosphoesterase
MQFGALGDVHGDFASVRAVMARHPDIPFWVSVGDIADAAGGYEAVSAPLYWIKGNNENFDAIAEGRLPANLHYLPNATLVTVGGVRIAGLGGTLAPTWYEMPASALPHPTLRQAQGRPEQGRGAKKGTARATELADRRRHFVREEVDTCKALDGIDLFLSHEAPRPFTVGRMDAGKTPINEVLAAMKPRLHLFGHHHRFSEQLGRQGVRSVGLDLAAKSYLLVDARTLEYHFVNR